MIFASFNYHEYDTAVHYSLTLMSRRGKKFSELLDELKNIKDTKFMKYSWKY